MQWKPSKRGPPEATNTAEDFMAAMGVVPMAEYVMRPGGKLELYQPPAKELIAP